MAPSVLPDSPAQQAILDRSTGNPEALSNATLASVANESSVKDGNSTSFGQLVANCTELLEQGVELLTSQPDIQAYTICQQQLQQQYVLNSTAYPGQDSNFTNRSEPFMMSAVATATGVDNDLLTPTRISVVQGWIQAISTRDDLLRISIQSTVLIAIFLASVLANSFVFVVFCRKPTLLSNSYRFVLNLAVCNCLMTVLVMPFVLISTFTQQWILGWGSCEIIGMLAITLFVASILTLLLIAMDRYHAIMKPLHYHLTLISKRSSLCIAGVWVLSLLIALPPAVGWNNYSYQPGKAMCTVTWRSPSIADRIYSFSFVLFCFVIPYFAMLWVYICAFRTAQRTTARARRNSVTPEHAVSASDLQGITQRMLGRERRRSSAASLFHSTTRRRSSSSMTRAILTLHRDDWKAAKTSLIVMSAFTVCWLPFFILITMEAIIGPSLEDLNASNDQRQPPLSGLIIPYWLEGSALCLALAGCALNPLVYVFRSEKIKFEFRRLFCPRSSRWNDQEKEASTTTNQGGGRRSSMQASKRGSPSLTGGSEKGLNPSVCTGNSSVRMSPCSSSASITTSAVGQAARIAGAAASLVVTFNEDARHKDGVCL